MSACLSLSFLPFEFMDRGTYILCTVIELTSRTELERVLLASSCRGVEFLADLCYSQANRRGEGMRVIGCGRLDLGDPISNTAVRFSCVASRSALFPAAESMEVHRLLINAFPDRLVALEETDGALMTLVDE
jgi:hypothetical protein